MKNKRISQKKAFTIIEIVIVLALASMVAASFANMFIFGVKGSNEHTEHVIAYNLAREKIEEIKSLPFELIQSDYEIFRDVFQDRVAYEEAYYNEESFEKYFSDVYTESEVTSDSEKAITHKKLKELYSKYYLKELDFYPDSYSKLRRVTKVEDVGNVNPPAKLKKITVRVYDEQKNSRYAELVTLIGQYK